MNKQRDFSYTTARLLLLLAALVIFTANEAKATILRSPKFGGLMLLVDKLIFTEPGWEPHRLICISKDAGNKLWEIIDPMLP